MSEYWSPEQRLAAFIAGQEKIAREVAEYEARVAEEAENKIYDMPNKGSPCAKQESPEQRLHRANMSVKMDYPKEAPLTDAERGMSEADFLKLSPERRLTIAHAATQARLVQRQI